MRLRERYSKLTAEQLGRLCVLAAERGDQDEIAAILRAVPRVSGSLNDPLFVTAVAQHRPALVGQVLAFKPSSTTGITVIEHRLPDRATFDLLQKTLGVDLVTMQSVIGLLTGDKRAVDDLQTAAEERLAS